MTLLAVVESGPVMLMAADSQELHDNYEAGFRVTVDKLVQMGDEKIVWGYWGHTEAGAKFAHRLAQESFGDWDALDAWVSPQRLALNGEHTPFGVLVAGWLGGVRRAMAYGDGVLSGTDFMFCGNGCLVGQVAWEVTTGLDVPLDERFKLVMTKTIEGGQPTLGFPLNMWEITEHERPRRIRGTDQPKHVSLGG